MNQGETGVQRTFGRRGARAIGLAARPPASFSLLRSRKLPHNHPHDSELSLFFKQALSKIQSRSCCQAARSVTSVANLAAASLLLGL